MLIDPEVIIGSKSLNRRVIIIAAAEFRFIEIDSRNDLEPIAKINS